ncbi:MAG: hypothetical protein ACHQFW_02110 [Chitinophagales bacterium]
MCEAVFFDFAFYIYADVAVNSGTINETLKLSKSFSAGIYLMPVRISADEYKKQLVIQK